MRRLAGQHARFCRVSSHNNNLRNEETVQIQGTRKIKAIQTQRNCKIALYVHHFNQGSVFSKRPDPLPDSDLNKFWVF
jgi:hypothetical protein